jgi:hypothetical protein
MVREGFSAPKPSNDGDFACFDEQDAGIGLLIGFLVRFSQGPEWFSARFCREIALEMCEKAGFTGENKVYRGLR